MNDEKKRRFGEGRTKNKTIKGFRSGIMAVTTSKVMELPSGEKPKKTLDKNVEFVIL